MARRALSIVWAVGLFCLLIWLYTTNGQNLQDAISNQPAAGLWIGFALIIGSQILAPLSGFPIFAILAKSYGLGTAVVVLYASYAVSSVVNFWIARRYGVPIVAKIVGASRIEQAVGWLDHRSALYVGLSRILGYYYHDIISYAWGLTQVKFRRYFAITLFVTLLPLAAEYAVLRNISLDSIRGLAIFYLAMLGVSLAFVVGWFIFQRVREKRQVGSQ